ncbi:hypothetical protein KQI86_17590 [Clostridium sp. MSJ-11]|uniref:Transmembrane protein n=1 Tax=Clostridium mobile TaxID=2841512 RepID=A0ABS6EM72_9CLOT|nr:hypothetical protein [Clostridium mobile]MBU5486133.1 hypothetical protein [Clostridium mobile]
MSINKAIIKQRKSYKIFMLIMSFIFFVLPFALILIDKVNIFYIIYLLLIEILIIIAILSKINNENFKINNDNYKIKIISGLKRDGLNIMCNKVAFVHIENYIRKSDKSKDFSIIIIASSKFRSDKMIPINEKFLKNHPYVAYHYNKIKILSPEKDYFFTIIKKGRYLKYELLDIIYRNCVYAQFTEETIDKIKEYRNEMY